MIAPRGRIKMTNNVVDKIYLALELTKLYITERDRNGIFSRDSVKDTFDYFFEELTGIENTSEYEDLKKENEMYKKKYEDLMNEFNTRFDAMLDYKLKGVKDFIDKSKGDMEPYVHQGLTELLK